MMDIKSKQAWINALRAAADYRQQQVTGYCALGVLTQLMNQGQYLSYTPQWVQGELFSADEYYDDSADDGWDEW